MEHWTRASSTPSLFPIDTLTPSPSPSPPRDRPPPLGFGSPPPPPPCGTSSAHRWHSRSKERFSPRMASSRVAAALWNVTRFAFLCCGVGGDGDGLVGKYALWGLLHGYSAFDHSLILPFSICKRCKIYIFSLLTLNECLSVIILKISTRDCLLTTQTRVPVKLPSLLKFKIRVTNVTDSILVSTIDSGQKTCLTIMTIWHDWVRLKN